MVYASLCGRGRSRRVHIAVHRGNISSSLSARRTALFWRTHVRRLILAMAISGSLISLPAAESQTPRAGRSMVVAPHAMVATSHPLAAQIGLDILKRGGNALDTAIPTPAAPGLMAPVAWRRRGDLLA